MVVPAIYAPAVQMFAAMDREPRDFLDVWFRPKQFETEHLYERLGALLLKRYVPTGGDLVMQLVRRRYPQFSLFDPASPESLRRLERGTRVAEAVHLVGFVGFSAPAVRRFSDGSLSRAGLGAALVMNLTFGLWPVVLQRYNRLRVYRAFETASRITSRRGRH